MKTLGVGLLTFLLLLCFRVQAGQYALIADRLIDGVQEQARLNVAVLIEDEPVSYTHLTLPTKLEV